MLAVPVLVIALLLAGRHLVEGLLIGVAAGLAVGLGAGLITWSQVMYIDAANFTAKGLIIDGITRGLGVSVFTIFLIGLVAALKATGLVERMAGAGTTGGVASASPRSAELRIFGAVSTAVLLTTHSVVAILTVGELASRLGQAVGIRAYRRANLLDVTVCTYPFLLPYFIPPILASSATSAGHDFGMPRISPFDAGMHNACTRGRCWPSSQWRSSRGTGGPPIAARPSSPWWKWRCIGRRCIPPRGVAPPSNTGRYSQSSRLAGRAPRRPRATRHFHHGLLGPGL